MFNVCINCGQYRADKVVDPAGPDAICPECGHRHPFLQQPLFVLGGASGSGKSTLVAALVHTLPQVVVLDSDILWMDEFAAPEQWPKYTNLWLRLCKNIGQSGRPVLLAGAGLAVPANLTACVEARYFSALHILALVCDDQVLAERLRARPDWRNCSNAPFIDQQVAFNRWLRQEGPRQTPPVRLLDTTDRPVAACAAEIRRWVVGTLERSNGSTT
ncbi:ATP-binding protein [Litorilinea aerophila]|nr:AAA family ATPase [Litorilinea aerophila]MCC9076700.1 ATP-binding protein [Litorilinea aerophila]GIV77747.1 MAG: nucleoside kinase [Litorilinea sp.]